MQVMKNTDPINGSFAEIWMDDEYMAEITKIEAKFKLEKEKIKQCCSLKEGNKITGYEGSGSFTMYKTDSFLLKKFGENMRKGKETVFEIIVKVDDPSSRGCERVKLIGCTIDELTIADWERKKISEISVPFTFEDYEVLDFIA